MLQKCDKNERNIKMKGTDLPSLAILQLRSMDPPLALLLLALGAFAVPSVPFGFTVRSYNFKLIKHSKIPNSPLKGVSILKCDTTGYSGVF